MAVNTASHVYEQVIILSKEFLESLLWINISLLLSFPLVGNPSGVMLYREQYRRAKKDSRCESSRESLRPAKPE